MKRFLITLLCTFLGCSIFAQTRLPFVSFKAVQADPVQFTPPRINQGSLYDPLGSTSMPSRVQSTSVQKEHFGMMLGTRYNTDNIAWDFLEHFGDRADFGSSGDFYQIRVYSKCSKNGGTFGGCTIDFYKGRFWKIVYHDIKNAPREFANNLENKLINYSISETSYEYQCGDIYIKFDGEDLRFVSESVTRAIAGY